MKIRNMESVIVPSVAAMQAGPDGNTREKQFLEKNNIKSFLILPLTIGPSVIGALGLETLQNETLWPEEDIDILKIYGQIIAGALARKAGEQAVHESEELYRTVFESTGTAMMILEENRMVSVVNREFERMKQYHALRRTNPDKVPRNYEFGFLSRDGKKISTYITVEMIPGTKKSVVSLINISREKSAQQELSDSEEKFRNLSESLAEGIYMIQDNRFIYVNPAFSRICGRSTEELTALTDFTEIFPESDRQRVRQSVSDRLSGLRTSERYSVSAIHKNGTLIPLTIHGSLTRYHGRQALIGTITMAGDP
jgi:PAS domain S-box-containing protein